jgi:lysozyme
MRNVGPQPKPAPPVKPYQPPAGQATTPTPTTPRGGQGGRWTPTPPKTPTGTDAAILAALERLVALQGEGNKTRRQVAEMTAVKRDVLELGVIWVVIALATLYMSLMAAMTAIADSPAGRFFGLQAGDRTERVAGQGNGGYYQNDRPLKLGDVVEGWRVTSPRGPRFHPVNRTHSHHGGADLANTKGATEGHPLVMPWNGRVECFSQRGQGGQLVGAGHGAKLNGGPGRLQLRAYHLQTACQSGNYKAGQVFGRVGNTGTSTAPHLHLERHVGGTEHDPTWGDAISILGLRSTGGGGQAMAQAIALIKEFEGFHPRPYSDFAQCSWGFGTKGPGRPGACGTQTITREQAEAELVAYLQRNCVPLLEGQRLSSGQFAAAASKCYNLGPAQFRSSRTYQAIARGDLAAATAGFDDPKWMNAGGRRLQGLVTRRGREKAIFANG